MARQETETSGLNREAVVQAALAMLDAVGVDGLSMRALADRLGVKAASLYWHLRDKDQLLELVAESGAGSSGRTRFAAVVALTGRRCMRRAGRFPGRPSGCRERGAGLAAGGPAQPPDARPGSRPCGRRPGGRRERRVHVGGRGCGVGVFHPLRDGAEAGWPGHDPGNQLGLMACAGPRRAHPARSTSRPRSVGAERHRWRFVRAALCSSRIAAAAITAPLS